MPTLDDVTLCCIDCLNHEASIRAIRQSLAQLQFTNAVLFSDREYQFSDFKTVQIPTIASRHEYSRFVVEWLVEYVSTPFLLIIQWDGYVIDGAAWRDSFKEYDYIGAVWEDGKVGNGGFSWRSRRLLQALKDPRGQSQGPEDEDIGRRFRPWLEKDYAIRFAEPEVAAAFSFERVPSKTSTLGFHGLFNMYRYVASTELDGFLAMLSTHTLSTPEMTEFGLAYWRNGQRDCAERVFQAVDKAQPDRADIRYLLEKFRQVPSSSADALPLNVDEILARGLRHHRANELRAAYPLYLLALVLEPNHARATHLVGVIAATGGQLDQAIALFRKAIRINGSNVLFHIDLANALSAQHKFDEAITYYRNALRITPDNVSLRKSLAVAEKAVQMQQKSR